MIVRYSQEYRTMTRLSKIARIRAASPRKRTSKAKRNFKNCCASDTKGAITPAKIHANAMNGIRFFPTTLN